MLSRAGGLVAAGDTIILISETEPAPRAIQVKAGEQLMCKTGIFPHSAFIGAKYGAKAHGRHQDRRDVDAGLPAPWFHVLRPTPELWTRALPHRTQIIYSADITFIVLQLGLRPGMVVAEAGTGSGSLTHALARAVAPTGKVHTFDFHKGRVAAAREEFARHGIASVVESGWADVCTVPGQEPSSSSADAAAASDGSENDDEEEKEKAMDQAEHPPVGYHTLGDRSVDAVFLDVPSPWLAVPNVLRILKPGGTICSYSPCIEQTQRFCQAVRQAVDPSPEQQPAVLIVGDGGDSTSTAAAVGADGLSKRQRKLKAAAEKEGARAVGGNNATAAAATTTTTGTSSSPFEGLPLYCFRDVHTAEVLSQEYVQVPNPAKCTPADAGSGGNQHGWNRDQRVGQKRLRDELLPDGFFGEAANSSRSTEETDVAAPPPPRASRDYAQGLPSHLLRPAPIGKGHSAYLTFATRHCVWRPSLGAAATEGGGE